MRYSSQTCSGGGVEVCSSVTRWLVRQAMRMRFASSLPARLLAAIGVAAALIATTSGWAAQAAVFSKSAKDVCVVRLEGEIVEGDLQRLEAVGKSEFKGSDGESSAKDTICLNSPGGSVAEGVRIAEYLYKNGIGTVIDEDDECDSICAIMFMMGIAQGAEVNFVNRKLHVSGKLGFHRPYLAIASDELISARALGVAHDAAVESIMKIMILANNHVPWSNSTMMKPDLVQQMLTHIGNDLYYIDTVEKAGHFEIELIGVEKASGLTEEQAYYTCENSFHWQVGLMEQTADFQKLEQNLGPNNGGNSIVKLLSNDANGKVYSVTSRDAGYSEAGCLIADKGTHIAGCGYNGMYNVTLGQGQCTLRDFDDRSVFIPRLATQKPDTPVTSLIAPSVSESTVNVPVPPPMTGTCTVLFPSGTVDQERCEATVHLGPDGNRVDRYEFVWPTGNKTIINRNNDALYINGKPAQPITNSSYSFCVLNSETRNRFCFKT